jgi:diguanylate cyclase (GGDEF)-like protein/PAS domain S-box-containing protein
MKIGGILMSKDIMTKNGFGGINMDFYKSIIERSPAGYSYHKIILDENNHPCDYEFIDVNIAFETITGLKRSDILGKNVSEVLPVIIKSEFNWIKFYGNTAINGESEEFEQFSEPLKRWYRVNVYSPEKYYFITYFTDITKEKSQTEELNSFFELNLDLLCVADNEGSFIKTNRSWEKTLGYSTADLKNRKFLDFVHPDDIADTLEAMRTLEDQMEVPNFINRYICKDGSYRWIEWRFHPNGKLIYAAARDITEQVNASREISFQASLLEQVHKGIIVVDFNNTIIFWNKFSEELYHWKSDEVIGKNIIDLLSPEEMKETVYENFKALNRDGHWEGEFNVKKKDGNLIPVHITNTYSKDVKGNNIGFIGVSRDITERKQAELELSVKSEALKSMNMALNAVMEALKESDLRFKIAVEGTETGIWDWDMIKDEVVFSIQWKTMLGYEDSEVENAFYGWKNLWHPDDVTSIEKALNDHLAGKTKKYEIIHRCRHKDGDWRWMVTRGTILKDSANKPYRWIGTNVDITELKKMERLLFSEKEQFKTTLLSVGDGVISTDVQGNVLIMNKISEELTGWTQEEAVGRSIEKVFPIINEFTRERCDNPARNVIDSGEILELASHTILISKDGFERPIEDSAAPIKNEQGDIIGAVLVFKDFTEKKKIQDEITYLSFHDYLTGLYNRRHYDEEIIRINTPQNYPITLVMTDMNNLKRINDTFGHVAGDRFLIIFSNVLKRNFRKCDMVARIGGDEFVILLPKTDSAETAIIINGINLEMASIFMDQIPMSAAFGWKTKSNNEVSFDSIFKQVEDMMYYQKEIFHANANFFSNR